MDAEEAGQAIDSQLYIDPRCECDAPTFVDFTEMSFEYDNADAWFDNRSEEGYSHSEEGFEDDFSKVKSESESVAMVSEESHQCISEEEGPPEVIPEPEIKSEESPGTKMKNTAKLVVDAIHKGYHPRSLRAAAKKANIGIQDILKRPHLHPVKATHEKSQTDSKKQVKTTEELQLEEIQRMQREAKRKLRRSKRSFHKLAKVSGPMRAIKGSKPPTETKEFNFKTTNGRKSRNNSSRSCGVRDVHPSNFANSLRSLDVADNITMGSKKTPTPEPTTRPKPFKFELDRRARLRSTAVNSKNNQPMAEFILKYQNSTPPRFRRKPSAPGSGKISENSGSQYNLGSHITMPKTPNLLTKSRKRSVACKSTAEVEEEEATKFEQYQFKANPLNMDIINKGGLHGVPRKKNDSNITRPVSPPLATKKLAEIRRAAQDEDKQQDIETGDKKFVAKPMPDFTVVKGLPTKRLRPITQPESPAMVKRRRLNSTTTDITEEEDTGNHIIRANPVPDFENVFVPQYPQRVVITQPFSFEARDKDKPSRQTLVEKILQKEQKPAFKAQPVPNSNFEPPFLPPKIALSTTKPEPFNLETEVRGIQHALKWKEQVEDQFQNEKQEAEFKAKDVSILYTKPFLPEISTKPLTQVENIILHSDMRSSQRAKYEAEKQGRINSLEVENLQRRALREAEEAKEISKYRKSLVHKAQPIGHYAPVVIKPSDRPVTQPISPHFETDKVLSRKH